MTGQASSQVVTRGVLAGLLEERIVSGELGPGERLASERQLASQYGVSRPLVREVLRGLLERGLIEAIPGRGTFVRQSRTSDAAGSLKSLYRLQRATAGDLVEARTVLECEAAAIAARRADRGDHEEMQRALAEFDESAGIIERARHDIAFHYRIVVASHNPVLKTMFASIAVLTFELMVRSLSDPTVATTAGPLHHDVCEAILSGDPSRARRAMSEHLAVATRLYGTDLNRSVDEIAQRELDRLLGPGVPVERLVFQAMELG